MATSEALPETSGFGAEGCPIKYLQNQCFRYCLSLLPPTRFQRVKKPTLAVESDGMGNIDVIELQILEILISVGSTGRNFDLPNLHKDLVTNNRRLAKLPPNEIDELIVGALIDLLQIGCIQIRHYIGKQSVRREGTETLELFYRGTFTCIRIIPTAFKRRDDLVGRDKQGVFMSHNVPERELPMAMKRFLALSLGPEYPIFVSSDLRSIQSGKPWFGEIVKAIQTAKAVLVLLTPDSMNQRWVNFEAGIGIGAGTHVIPILARGTTKGSLGLPLNQLQARDLSDKDDLKGMIKDLEEMLGGRWSDQAVDDLFVELERVSGELDRGSE